MTYANKSEMQARFRERELIDLTNKGETSTGAIVDTVLNEALDDGASDIDRALTTAGYILPLASAPAFLVRINCDLARWYLQTRAGQEVKDSEIRLRYEDAVAMLKEIAAGKMVVPGATRPSDDAYAGVSAGNRTMTFGSDFESKFDVRDIV